MTAIEAQEIAKKIKYNEHDIVIALLEAARDGWSDGYRECDKTLAVYQHRTPILEEQPNEQQ